MKAVALAAALILALSPMALAADSEDAYGVGLDFKLYENPDWAVEQIDLETRWNIDDRETSAYIVGKIDLFKQLGVVRDRVKARACQSCS